VQPFAPHRLEGTPYRIDSVLGEGAMGEVYLGEHVDLRRPAVIKLIKAKFAREEQVAGRMRREARIVARIRHDALVTIYDLGTTADGRTYIAMEYLEGTVLRKILQTRGVIALDETAKWMAQCCDGLDVAHREGVIHRDIKPENLFIAATGQLKVLDFGVAKPMNEGDMTSARTAAGMVLGTPRYMAPEQATGRALSGATDVYAVGCVFFELLTGSPVFDAADARDMLWHHLNTAPPTLALRTHRAFDPRAEAIVARALQKDPAHRFANAAEMAIALRELTTRTSAAPRLVSVHDKVTVRVDDPETIVDDVHGKATIRVDAPGYAHATDAFPLERRNDPARVSYSPPGSTPVSGYDETRAIPSMNLVQGVSTTEQQPVVATAQTEALNPINAEVSTLPVDRRGMPLWPIAIAVVFLAFVGTALVFVMRTGREVPAVTEQPTLPVPAKTFAAPTPEPTPSTAAALPAVASTTTKPIETAAAPKATAPKATTSAKPSVEAPAPTAPTQSAYDRAKQLMNDGDLDAAEREARAAVATHGNGARLLLGEILERKGKPALARDVYKKILESDPNNATAKTRLAKLGG
jgi:serine/threonine protein kinase